MTYHVSVGAERTVRAAAEDCGSRDTDLPVPAWSAPVLSCLVLSLLCSCSATLHKNQEDLANSRSHVCGRQRSACRVPLQPQREKVHTTASLQCSLTVAVQLGEGEGERGSYFRGGRPTHTAARRRERTGDVSRQQQDGF